MRYGIEDKIKQIEPEQVYTEGTTLAHGRITSRTCRIYRGEELIVDKEKWQGKPTVVEVLTETTVKSTGQHVSEQRLYVSGLDCDAKKLNEMTRRHWSIESLHWSLDSNLPIQSDMGRGDGALYFSPK